MYILVGASALFHFLCRSILQSGCDSADSTSRCRTPACAKRLNLGFSIFERVVARTAKIPTNFRNGLCEGQECRYSSSEENSPEHSPCASGEDANADPRKWALPDGAEAGEVCLVAVCVSLSRDFAELWKFTRRFSPCPQERQASLVHSLDRLGEWRIIPLPWFCPCYW